MTKVEAATPMHWDQVPVPVRSRYESCAGASELRFYGFKPDGTPSPTGVGVTTIRVPREGGGFDTWMKVGSGWRCS